MDEQRLSAALDRAEAALERIERGIEQIASSSSGDETLRARVREVVGELDQLIRSARG